MNPTENTKAVAGLLVRSFEPDALVEPGQVLGAAYAVEQDDGRGPYDETVALMQANGVEDVQGKEPKKTAFQWVTLLAKGTWPK